jgi:putative ATP-dependent endonuclease of OLD family
MKISQIIINNYRLLKDFTIDLEDILSLAIGKNNCGKTSFLSLLEKFLFSNDFNNFSFEDLNIENQQELKIKIEADGDAELIEDYGIFLKLYIEYSSVDNLSNISSLMLDLNPDLKTVVLSFEYSMSPLSFFRLRKDYEGFRTQVRNDIQKSFEEKNVEEAKRAALSQEILDKKNSIYFLKKYHQNYFSIVIKALEFGNESNFIDISNERKLLDRVINFKRIKAKRDVANEDGTAKKSDRTLSKMSAKYYDKISNAENEAENIKTLQNELSDTDDKLNAVYKGLFANVVSKVRRFGGIREDDSKLIIVSSLEEKNLLSNNTTVMYQHFEDHSLPEDYNGLGYMNLIAIIFEIEVLLNDFKKTKIREEVPADINLLFIEEPEAHTHPQMQYVFIKNIKSILDEARLGVDDGIKFNLQTIITTHSSHITAESDFEDIKYFSRQAVNRVVVKNLKDLKSDYAKDDAKDYQFLKQYLTLHRTELFFADKAVFIEGDTERLLLPAMMRKLDIEQKDNNLALLSQNISVIEVGAHCQIFEKFIDFLEIKALVITDIDSCKLVKSLDKAGVVKKSRDGEEIEHPEKSRVAEGVLTSNSALGFFFKDKTFAELKVMETAVKILAKRAVGEGKSWISADDGKFYLCYQTLQNEYHARSFEDSFIHLNREWIKINKDNFKGLKNRDELDLAEKDAYELADLCIDKKTLFALDILFLSKVDFSDWHIPAYIQDGLLWLKK